MTESVSQAHRRRLIGIGAAVILAAATVVAFVLPADFGIDPTGIGRATGLTRRIGSLGI